MTRDDMYDLIMGAAVIAIGYMLWKQHKGQGASTATGPAISVPAPIEVTGDDKTGYWYDLDNLLSGVTS